MGHLNSYSKYQEEWSEPWIIRFWQETSKNARQSATDTRLTKREDTHRATGGETRLAPPLTHVRRLTLKPKPKPTASPCTTRVTPRKFERSLHRKFVIFGLRTTVNQAWEGTRHTCK
ncbi:uncharacterized protein LOC111462017 [Cucurbita moschata]|uniref:Uncharacterized protein LOC111462017 n=1 Tax=Cucurbita moschata TaxID=3662 RepID=A0A6J1HE09_CUCMO|nr:uncharacterized protein LOC111462017 [Cucurbita moschata]